MNVNNIGNTMMDNYDVKKMGKQDFLKLFVAQLKFQDPLEPLKNEDFTAQLAQFSSLEELGNIKDEIAKLAARDNMIPFMYSGLIGKTVKIADSDISEGKVSSLKFDNNEVYLKLDNAKEVNLKDVIEIK